MAALASTGKCLSEGLLQGLLQVLVWRLGDGAVHVAAPLCIVWDPLVIQQACHLQTAPALSASQAPKDMPHCSAAEHLAAARQDATTHADCLHVSS